MANKDQRRGNREARKPKQQKARLQALASPFALKGGTALAGPNPKK